MKYWIMWNWKKERKKRLDIFTTILIYDIQSKACFVTYTDCWCNISSRFKNYFNIIAWIAAFTQSDKRNFEFSGKKREKGVKFCSENPLRK